MVSLAQAIHRGEICAEEIKTRNLVSGLQYIADPAQTCVEDLRHEIAALRIQVETAISAQEISDAAADAKESLAAAEATSCPAATWKSRRT